MSSGDNTTLLASSAAQRGSSAIRALELEHVKAKKKTTLAGGSGVVGRAATTDFPLTEDETVSQFHVELVADGDLIRVTDLGSRNGTHIESPLGLVSIERGRVPSGTTLLIGGTAITVRIVQDRPATTKERSKATSFGGLVGSSPAMRETYALLEKLARSNLSVLIEGATGTGKELAARALHDESERTRGKPFVPISCAAIPPHLAEKVLFGEEDGRAGIFEAAQGGTVLLDHVAELSLELQAKLLRALDQREVIPVGGSAPRSFDARIVSIASSLRPRVNQGAFREDLYFRLAQARVVMPGLEQRREDKKPLAQHFLGLVKTTTPSARAFESDALDAIAARIFDGHVRELRNTVERAAVLAEGPVITAQDLAFERVLAAAPVSSAKEIDDSATGDDDASASTARPIEAFKDAKRTVIDDFEKKYLLRILARSGKNVSRAAALAGIERQSLRDLLKRHGLRGGDDST